MERQEEEVRLDDSFTDGDPATVAQHELEQRAAAHSQKTFAKELSRFGNMFVNGAIVSTLRLVLDPSSYAVQPPPGLPDWAAAEYKQRYMLRRFTTAIMRDAAVFTGSMYVWETTEKLSHQVRGVDDPWNRVLGGLVGGTILGSYWIRSFTPAKVASFAAISGLFGYWAYLGETQVKSSMLNQQRQLEKELLKKDNSELKDTVDPGYLRELVLMKQKAMSDLWESQVSGKGHVPDASRPSQAPSEFTPSAVVTQGSEQYTAEPTLVIQEEADKSDTWEQTRPVQVEQRGRKWF